MKNNFISTLNKISLIQFSLISAISFAYLFCNQHDIFSGLFISAFISSLFIQLIKLSSYSRFFSLFGFPVRLIVTATPCAILVHKFHSNLIALFVGFAISQIIYFIFIWSFTKEIKGNI